MRLTFTLAFLLSAIFIIGCNRSANDSSSSQNGVGGANSTLVVRELDSPAGVDSREPELYAGADGQIILSWVEKLGEKRHALRLARREANGWSQPIAVAEGNNWFVNWADFPSIITMPNDSLAAHWLVKSGAGAYAYDVNIARSVDGGKTWGKTVIPHTDGTETEHGFVSLLPLADGRVGAAWLDGRNFKGVKESEEHGPSPANMTLRYAAIDAEGKLSDEALLDERVCECCQTGAAMTSEGAIVAYRDRSEAEVRDIYYVRQQRGGGWSAPKPLHADGWEISACPVNGPSVAAENRRVVIAWYTEANDKPRVQVAFSDDAGATFGGPILVDDKDALGRVDVLLLADGSALVSWLSGTAEGGAIKVRRVTSGGALGAVTTVAKTEITRSSGFPRMTRRVGEVFIAWTQPGKPSRVRTAAISLSVTK